MLRSASTMLLDEGMLSDRGSVRALNEDSYGSFHSVLDPPGQPRDAELLRRLGRLYVVADGMGGHDGGEIASATAVQQICRAYYDAPDDEPEAALRRAIGQANSAIQAIGSRRRAAGRPMGTTVVCAAIRADRLTVAHIGDSRAYRLRDGALEQLTEDHDWTTEQMHRHGLSRAEAERRAAARGAHSTLLRALGVEAQARPDLRSFDWRPGDVLLLSSDGLHRLVSDATIARVLAAQPAPLAARELIALANRAGGPDNITALVVRGTPEPVSAGAPPWLRLAQALALALTGLLLLVGLSGRVPSAQTLELTNSVRQLAGQPTLHPTVGLLPTATPTPTPTATSTPTPTNTPTPRPTARPRPTAPPATARPVAPSQREPARLPPATAAPPAPTSVPPTAAPSEQPTAAPPAATAPPAPASEPPTAAPAPEPPAAPPLPAPTPEPAPAAPSSPEPPPAPSAEPPLATALPGLIATVVPNP